MIDLNKSQIQEHFDLSTAAQAIEAAYIASAEGRVQAPPVTYLGFYDANGDCHVKTGHVLGTGGFVIKVATDFMTIRQRDCPVRTG